jgi:serine/threonine-protein kinase HipA
MGRRALVQLAGEPVGHLEETAEGYTFAYLAPWVVRADARPVSLTLPVRTEPYLSPRLHPAFANLLPEGWLLDLSIAKLKISADDVFGLLLAVCRDCVGEVEILPLDEEAL